MRMPFPDATAGPWRRSGRPSPRRSRPRVSRDFGASRRVHTVRAFAAWQNQGSRMSHVDAEFLGLFDDLSDRDDDPDGPLLREFIVRWEDAKSPADREAALGGYVAAHPRLEGRFREHIAATNIFRDAPEQQPTRLGPYRILRLLASGGMGKVYEAEDELLGRTVAVKTIRLGRAADGRLLGQFEREREALAHLHHTHIVPIYGAGEDDGLLYFAMPLIKGLSLADLV